MRANGHVAARDGLCNLETERERTAARRYGWGCIPGPSALPVLTSFVGAAILVKRERG